MLSKEIISKYIRLLEPLPTRLTPRLPFLENIKIVFFDVYGTLLISGTGDIGATDAKTAKYAQIKGLCHKYGISISPQTLLERLENAIKERHAELKLQGVDYPEVRIENIWSVVLRDEPVGDIFRFAAEYELISNPVYPMPHLMEVLNFINSNGYKMGIISNAQFYTPWLFKWLTGASVAELGFEPALCLYSFEIETAKPSSALFQKALKAIRKYSLNPESVLYIGNDMLNDIYPASRIGFRTVLFAGDQRSLRLRESDSRIKGIEPDAIMTDLSQIRELLLLSSI